ncbi:MAG: universal stress protein [Fimbriimonas sp.]|nr:universal stress protein [Fimbriimonas sp.]
MNTIVGVDITGTYESALRILARLKIDSTTLKLVHVDEPPLFSHDEGLSWTPEFLELRDRFDEGALNDAGAVATDLGFKHETLVTAGSPAEALMGQADEAKADLIAVGSSPEPKVTALFFGSVGRALAIGSHQSVLIAKGSVEKEGPLTILVTTDHSRYSDYAIGLLASLQPKGIGRLVLLTAIDDGMVGGADPAHIEKVRQHMEAKSKEIVDRFAAVGIPSEYRVVEQDLDGAIEAQMKELGAELLVMGAQGHGFIQRLFIGSVSLKQVVASRHSILILRPQAVPE